MRQDGHEQNRLSPEELRLWERHRSDPDGNAKEALIERYLPVAKKIAAALYGQRHDASVEFADYLQCARLGLLEAVERYDPRRGASFETYASYRIRGAILSGLDRATEVASQKAQRRRMRRDRLRSISEHASANERQAFIRMVDVTLSLAIGYLLEEAGGAGEERSGQTPEPYASVELEQVRRRLAQLVESLPERERNIIHCHYFEHREFSEIGALIGLSKGRVSQLHARALRKLREEYEAIAATDRRV